MDDKTIAIASMLATVRSAELSYWTLIASICSSFATLFIAFMALNTWRSQERVKLKINFKMAVAKYLEVLIYLPPVMSGKGELSSRYNKHDLINSLVLCKTAWSMTEGVFNGTAIENDWNIILDNHAEYLKGSIDSRVIYEACERISSSKILGVIFIR
ncbi:MULTISPECIES: hypothetical protein [Klebsiella]|nr:MULTISPECIES: hypothetical protein [Klebsiella]MBS5172734.1 hypothetical protein [Klebsiella oxytoca]MDU0863026.1 hypothetical protein [Serratia marcescens]MBC4288183.1 hypothetical protein [Klebsiella quasipneumoniae]MBM7150150.1 hypothetical protein [Klebsiella variicola]MCM5820482.1 hypothetical protein [Klebsiella pneumoniae]